MHPNIDLRNKLDTHFLFHGVHAQNYHIFTPAQQKDWAMVWGSQPWIKDLPFANAAYNYNFRHGENGKLVLEFFVTPFDYAPPERSRAIQTTLQENKVIGMSWAVLDYDDEKAKRYAAFWNLSHRTTMYGNASDLVAFRLMPIETSLRKPVEGNWSFEVISRKDRIVSFRDRSFGTIDSWHWNFGDGTTSTEQHPLHHYSKAGEFVVTLSGAGTGRKGPSHESLGRHTTVDNCSVFDFQLPRPVTCSPQTSDNMIANQQMKTLRRSYSTYLLEHLFQNITMGNGTRLIASLMILSFCFTPSRCAMADPPKVGIETRIAWTTSKVTGSPRPTAGLRDRACFPGAPVQSVPGHYHRTGQ